MTKIVLASHGPLANALIESCKMLYGESENISAVCLFPEDSTTDFASKIKQAIDVNDDILLMVDIPGGTPSNQGMLLLEEYPNLRILSGMNLMMVLEALIKCETTSVDDLVEQLTKSGIESIRLMKIEKVDNDLDLLMD